MNERNKLRSPSCRASMAKTHLLLLLLLLSFHRFSAFMIINPDIEPLLSFKTTSDTSNKLHNWNNTTDPCTWYGVSCIQNRVSRLVLEGLDLHGGIQSLASLNQLRLLSLKRNHLSGPIPDLSNLTALKLLFLSNNDFSGVFPPSVPFLFKLYRLDLAFNNLSGPIPANVNRLTHLLTLRLEENHFSGPVSVFSIPSLQDFNVSGNRFNGEIPKSLSGFPVTAFDKNLVLCGSPLPSCKDIISNPSKPGSEGSLAPVSPVTGIVSSSPSSKPVVSTQTPTSSNSHHTRNGKMSVLQVVAIIVGDVLVLALISGLLFYYFWRNVAGKRRDGKSSQLLEGEKIVYSSSPYPTTQGGGGGSGIERGKMVFFEGAKRFELEDLLRASAEMLGKGGFGTAYKAILDDGNIVAVKRLKETNQLVTKRDFEQHMEVLGHLRHSNVVTLMAYYCGNDEKLLVYDYMPNGSLFWLLHGNRGPGRTPLDWTTRLKIAAGAARGVAFIHQSGRNLKLSHGNIKSTNVLLDKSGNARVSDFGLTLFASPVVSNLRANGYNAPETLSDGRKFTQKSDVFAFGVLLLEILTGKCPLGVENVGQPGSGGGVVDLPRWVQSVVREEWTAEVFDLELMRYKDIEEEMVGLLQIAMACTSVGPDQRPKMGEVVKMIEEIRGAEDESLSHDESLDSVVSDSPSVSEGTTRPSQ